MPAKALLLFFTLLGLSITSLSFAHGAYPEFTPPKATERGEEDVVLIVAIDEYAFLPNVAGARQNADDWERYFREARGVGEVLTISDQNATREDILDFATRAVEATNEGGLLWFVFIGHGAPGANGEDGVMVGMDARANVRSLQSRGVGQKELTDLFSQGRQRDTVMVIDACFSGVTADGQSLAPGTQPVIPMVSAPETDGFLILSAARADQIAGDLPGANRPAFSYLLLGALSGWAADESGEVSAAHALTFVERHLRAVPGRTQTPVLYGNRNFVLARNLEARPTDLTALIARGGAPAAAVMEPGPRREAGSSSIGPRFTLGTGSAMVVTGGALLGHSIYIANRTQSRLDAGDPDLGRLEAQRAEEIANRNAGLGIALLGVGAFVSTAGWLALRRERTQFAMGVQPDGTTMVTFSGQW